MFSLSTYKKPLIILSSIFFIFSLQNKSYSQNTNSIENLSTLFGVKLGSDISTLSNIKFITEDRNPEIIRKASFTPKLKNELIGNYYVYFYPLSKKINRIEGESKQTFTNPLYGDGCDKLELKSAYNYLQQKLIKESQGVRKDYYVSGFDLVIYFYDRSDTNPLSSLKKEQAVKNFEKLELNYRCVTKFPISSPLKGVGIIKLSSFDVFQEGKEEDIIRANKTKQKEKDLKESGKFKNF